MSGHLTPIFYALSIFLVVGLGGLAVLRRQRNAGTRMFVFLLFSVACVFVTLWTTKRWQLLMGEAAIAWIVALLLIAVIAASVMASQRHQAKL